VQGATALGVSETLPQRAKLLWMQEKKRFRDPLGRGKRFGALTLVMSFRF
jgi:hypothetical protein